MMRFKIMGRMWLSLLLRRRGRHGKFAVKKVKRPELETLLKKVCIIRNNSNEKPQIAGGVFISKKGLIATCYHILLGGSNLLRIDFSGSSRMFDAEVYRSFPQFDLAILRVLDGNEKFEPVKVPRKISLDWGDSVFGFSQSKHPFSVGFGRVAYPYSKWTKLPGVEEDRTEVGGVFVNNLDRSRPWLETQHYLTLNEDDFSTLLPNLPVIKVHGVCADLGSSGCPLFVRKSLEFVGIATHSRGGRSYFAPSTMIRKLLPL